MSVNWTELSCNMNFRNNQFKKKNCFKSYNIIVFFLRDLLSSLSLLLFLSSFSASSSLSSSPSPSSSSWSSSFCQFYCEGTNRLITHFCERLMSVKKYWWYKQGHKTSKQRRSETNKCCVQKETLCYVFNELNSGMFRCKVTVYCIHWHVFCRWKLT